MPEAVSVAVDVDDSEHKYAKRPVADRLARVVNNQIGHGAVEAGDDGMSGLKRMALIALVVIIAVVSLLEALSRARPSERTNALLDPGSNPNLRVAAD